MDELTRLLLAARDRAALNAFVRAAHGDVWRVVTHRVGPGAADDVDHPRDVAAG